MSNPDATITETPSIEQIAIRADAAKAAAASPPPAPPPTPEEAAKAEAEKAAADKARELAELSEAAKAQRQKLLERRKLQAERESLRSQRAQFEAAAKEREELAKQLAAAKADPLRFAEESGLTAEQLVGKVVKANTPEAHIEALRAEIAALKADADKRQAEEERRAKEQSEAQQQQAYRKAQADFIDLVAKGEDKYPTISAMATTVPHLVWAEAEALVSKVLEYNRTHPHEMVSYTDEEIASFLEQRMTPVYKKLEERKKVAAPSPDGKTDKVAGTAGAGSAGPRTLSNSLQSETASEQLDLTKLSPQQQIAELAKVYERHSTTKRGA